MIQVKPRASKSFETRQSPTDFLHKLPARIIVSGPSGTGKGVLVFSMLQACL